ncbi:MAG: GntR family transcriptional regulator [Proteobacteria bacterium]|nr:GntR family transcriptional regulator [Pseudomonadota bacterium]
MSVVTLPIVEKHDKIRRSAAIATQLKEMILDGVLKAGDRLPTEEQLCRHFGVSRTTLRESVQMLRVSGLLEVTPGRGSFVRVPDLRKIMDDVAVFGCAGGMDDAEVQNLIALLQHEMVRRACRAPAVRKSSLTDYPISRLAPVSENERAERAWLLAIASVSGYKVGRMLLEVLLTMTRRQRQLRLAKAGEVQRLMEVQLRLNAAIIDGNADMAGRVMEAYLQSCKDGTTLSA